MGNITDSLKYDLKSIFGTGDLDTVSAEYRSQTAVPVTTDILFKTEVSVTEDGRVLGQYQTAKLLIEKVPDPDSGDTFYVAATLKTYKVLEILLREAAHTTVVIEEI